MLARSLMCDHTKVYMVCESLRLNCIRKRQKSLCLIYVLQKERNGGIESKTSRTSDQKSKRHMLRNQKESKRLEKGFYEWGGPPWQLCRAFL